MTDICKSLGIKAAGFFDSPPSDNPNEQVQTIKKAQEYVENAPSEFKVIQHNYEDIRVKDKSKGDKKDRTGLFERDGRIKDINAEELKKYLHELIDFFKNPIEST